MSRRADVDSTRREREDVLEHRLKDVTGQSFGDVAPAADSGNRHSSAESDARRRCARALMSAPRASNSSIMSS